MVLVVLFVVGAVMGSFACCQVRRMRRKEEGKGKLGQRSVCFSCGYRLKWYDNLPILSWMLLRGKCRKCGAKIGVMEILSEVGLGVVFMLMGAKFLLWSGCGFVGMGCGFVADVFLRTMGGGDWFNLLLMGVMMVEVVLLWILLLYDAKWGRLPVNVMIWTVVVAGIYAGIRQVGLLMMSESMFSAGMRSMIVGTGMLAGVYYILYRVSKERLMGGGDWILCLAIGLLLGDWWLVLMELFMANFLGSMVMMVKCRGIKDAKGKVIYFGPFLVVGFLLVFLMQDFLRNLIVL